MQTAAYVRTLTSAGVELAIAQAHAEALEDVLTDKFVTRDHFDARMATFDAKIDRLDAKLDAKIDRLDAKLDVKIDRLDAKLDTQVATLDAKIDSKVAGLEAKISEATTTTVKWMIGQTIGLAALIVALSKLIK